MLVMFAVTPVVSETAVPVAVTNSPTLPAAALLFVDVPTIFGVVIVGDVPKTNAPLPVSSEITPASCADVVEANCASVPEVEAAPVTLAAVRFAHAGGDDAPCETTACPAVEPVGSTN
jgi:hypothetical protein